jgi:hypothetical protein
VTGRVLRLAPLLAALALLAAGIVACGRAADGGGQSGPYIGLGGGLNRAAR